MKKLVLLFLGIALCNVMFGQQQTFERKLDVPGSYLTGTEKYQYLETDSTTIKHSTYSISFTCTPKDGHGIGGKAVTTIKGQFTNNKFDGTWTYSKTFTDFYTGASFWTGSITLTQSWKNGMPHGKWIYAYSVKYRHRPFNYKTRTYSWSQFEKVNEPKYVTYNFEDGFPHGRAELRETSGSKIIGYWVFHHGIQTEFYFDSPKEHMIAGNKGVCTSVYSLQPYGLDYKMAYTSEDLEVIKQINEGTKVVDLGLDIKNDFKYFEIDVPKIILGYEFWEEGGALYVCDLFSQFKKYKIPCRGLYVYKFNERKVRGMP